MERKGKDRFTLFAVCLAMVLAVLVRIPPAFSVNRTEHAASLTDHDGLPYFSQADAYYHIRMGDEIASKGYFGTIPEEGTLTDGEDTEDSGDLPVRGGTGSAGSAGELMDMLSYAPEGHRADHQDGIVKAAAAAWKIINYLPGISVSLHTTEFYISCLFAALTALVVFLLGKRLSNTAGGFFAAVFAVCAPAFAVRTAAGTFDTDMVQPLLTALMSLLIMETVCARGIRYAMLMALGTAVTAEVYMQCWGSNALAFILMMLAGGGAALVLLMIERGASRPGAAGYGTALLMTAVLLFAMHGSSMLSIMLSTFNRFVRTERVVSGDLPVLPDLFRSISELQPVSFMPQHISEWLWYTGPAHGTVLSGLGGILVILLVPSGLAALFLQVRQQHKIRTGRTGEKQYPGAGGLQGETPVNGDILLSGLAMLTVWLGACLYAATLGNRFIEHLAIPAGILAGCACGSLYKKAMKYKGQKEQVSAVFGMIVCLLAAALSVCSAWSNCSRVLPSTCDAQESAMDWIAEHAASPDAVIASWWDQGFFYAYESGHPVLWDGLTQDSVRAILLGKALITDNKAQSRNLLLMLSGKGHALLEAIREELRTRDAYTALEKASALTGPEAVRDYFRDEWDLSDEKAEVFAGMMFPEKPRETYLVLSTGMMMRLGYIEYYANCDFTGTQPLPITSAYDSYPDGFGKIDPEKGDEDPLLQYRQKETIWQLFFDRDGTYEDEVMFERVYEAMDGVEQVQIWRVNHFKKI